MTIAANKFHGVRAAMCRDEPTAEISRRHNDANVLVLGRDYIQAGSEREILRTWLESPFERGVGLLLFRGVDASGNMRVDCRLCL